MFVTDYLNFRPKKILRMQKYLDIDSSRKDRHVLEDSPEASGLWKSNGKLNLQQQKLADIVSTGGGAEPICWCSDKSLSAVMKWLQLVLLKVNIKLSIIVIS